MKRKFKSFIAVFLSLMMILSLAVPAFAAFEFTYTGSQVPVIFIRGDGETLCDKDGNEMPNYVDMFAVLMEKMQDDEGGSGEVYKSMANVLLPFLIEGLGTGNYDKYYEMLYKEVSELFKDMLLDENGEASNGSGISEQRKADMAYDLSVDNKEWRGYYTLDDYNFWYDWRLDPLKTADDFNAYIKGVKEVTGCSKVAIVGRCLGTTVVTAYLAKYGTDDIQGVTFDVPVANGAEIFSESISGKFKLDGNAINRFIIDNNGYGSLATDPFLSETLDLLTKAGVFESIVGVTKETVYYTVVKGVTSALALSTLATWPSFWATVSSDDYDDAMEYVFGDEGSAKRQQYAGLIEKIENYNTIVRENTNEILEKTNENANFGILCKYGSQITPIVESRNELGDQYGTLARSSYGATTADIYTTLSDSYIEQRVAEGKGKYIAPDKQVDASTCLFPDQTWFFKGTPHGDLSDFEEAILYTVATSDRQITVDDSEYGQFIVCDYANETFSKMTEENCDTYFWKAEEKVDNATGNNKLFYFLLSFINWLISAFDRIFNK